MSPESAPAQTEPKPMNEWARISGVFFEPGKTFADIARRPRWFVPLLIGVLFSAGYLYAFGQRIGWEPYMHRLLDNNARMQQLDPEQRQRVFDLQLKFASVGSLVSAAVVLPLLLMLWSAMALGIVKGLLGVPISFRQAFAAFCYGGLPRAMIYSTLATVVVFLTKNPDQFDVQNGFFSNPAALMDPQTSSKFLYTVAGALDVFVIWTILLAATGLKAAAGKRLSFGGALFAVAVPGAVWILIRGALAAAGLSG